MLWCNIRGKGMQSDKRYAWFKPYLTPPVRELMDAGPSVARNRLGSPRRAHVCILFSDIRGYTALSRNIDPDALRRTANRYIARHAWAVERHGGYVDNFTGDGVMAVFEGEGMTEAACHCALEIVGMARQWQRAGRHGAAAVGVGLQVGDVVMGTLGCQSRMTYTAIGETVNTAARLCQHARGPDVITTQAVRDEIPEDSRLRFDRLLSPGPEDLDPALTLYWLERN